MRIAAMALGLAFGLGTGAIHAHAPSPRAPAQNMPSMDSDRIERLLRALDSDLRIQGNGWRLGIEGQLVLVVLDEGAGRLRAMVPITSASDLERGELERLLHANFDRVLDARYALAEGFVWAVFERPLAGLDKTQVISGLAQVVTLARNHDAARAAGALRFGMTDRLAEDGREPQPEIEAPPGAALLERLLRLDPVF